MTTTPQAGDIWLNTKNRTHYLVVGPKDDMGIITLKGWRFLVLETGLYDAAYNEHFFSLCERCD